MENNDRPGRIERAALDAKDYAMWSLDRFRLSLIDNLSTFVSTLFSVFVLIVLAGIGAMFFAAALTWLLGMLIGSMLAAILIMGGLFVLLALIVYGRRKRLILNQTVRMFSRMMSDLGDKSQLCFMRNDNVFVENVYHLYNNEYLSPGAFALCEHFLPWSASTGQVFIACRQGPGYSVEIDGNNMQKMINTEKEFIGGVPADFCPQSMDCVTNWDYLISAGKLYTRENLSGMDAQYQEGSFPNFPVEGDYELLPWTMRGNIYFGNDVIAFDKKHCSYVLLRNGEMKAFDYINDETKAFKPSDMGKMLLGGGPIETAYPMDKFLTFVKETATGKIFVQKFQFWGYSQKTYKSLSEVEFPDPSIIQDDSKFAVCVGRKNAYITAGKVLYVYNYEDNLVNVLRDDFTTDIREIALCATNYERLAIALENVEDPSKSDFMILDVVCLWISFTLAFGMRHGSLNVFANSLYRDMMWSLALMDIVVIFYKIGSHADVAY